MTLFYGDAQKANGSNSYAQFHCHQDEQQNNRGFSHDFQRIHISCAISCWKPSRRKSFRHKWTCVRLKTSLLKKLKDYFWSTFHLGRWWKLHESPFASYFTFIMWCISGWNRIWFISGLSIHLIGLWKVKIWGFSDIITCWWINNNWIKNIHT